MSAAKSAIQASPDGQTRAIIERLEREPFLDPSMPAARMRENFDAFYRVVGPSPVEVAKIEERTIAGPGGDIRLRIYRPQAAATTPVPVLIFYHGGGMIMGSLDSYDSICRRLSRGAEMIVVSVDYRLAPDHKFPAAVDDAYDALCWTHRHAASFGGDPARLAVGGESAGGNLAAVVSQLARDRNGPPLRFQLLIYPAVGTRGHSRSFELFGKGYFFESDALEWLYSQYLDNPAALNDPKVSPILARDFTGLPPAFVVTAGFDILRDDGEQYAELMRDAGVPVELHRYETTIHGFVCMAGAIDVGREAIDECADKLRHALAKEEQMTKSEPYQVAFENEYVRIVHVNIAADEDAPKYVPVSMPIVRVDLNSGKTNYVEQVADLDMCDRKASVREIRVELRSAPTSEPLELDAVRLDPVRYTVDFENEHVRIVRLAFKGHEKGLMVSHPPRVLVTLTDVAVKLKFLDGRTDERGAPAGLAGWLETETLQTENARDEPLQVVLVEPKSARGF